MADKERFTQRFMRWTGKTGAIFGPAQQGLVDGPMTEANAALLKKQQAEAEQWETVTCDDGRTYVVPRGSGETGQWPAAG
jgi:hypothetical protein